MPIGFFAREWERTCSECGYTWRVPRSIARRGIRGMSAISMRGQFVDPRASNAAAARQMQSGIGARADLMEGFQICARCQKIALGRDDHDRHLDPREDVRSVRVHQRPGRLQKRLEIHRPYGAKEVLHLFPRRPLPDRPHRLRHRIERPGRRDPPRDRRRARHDRR